MNLTKITINIDYGNLIRAKLYIELANYYHSLINTNISSGLAIGQINRALSYYGIFIEINKATNNMIFQAEIPSNQETESILRDEIKDLIKTINKKTIEGFDL